MTDGKIKTCITGIGCISAAGNNLSENVEALFGKMRNFGPPARFQTDHPQSFPVFEVAEGAFCGDDRLTRTANLMLCAAREALSHACLSREAFCGLRVGVCMGTAVGSTLNSIELYDDFRSSRPLETAPLHRYLASNPAACLAKKYGLTGPVQTVVNACSSGTDALGIASSWIEQGVCDIAIAGGADELSRVSYNGFISLMISDPEPSRPFDKTRNGLNLGEGAAVMVLEPEHRVAARKKNYLGQILSYGTACDAHHLVSPHPEGRGLKRALADALDRGGAIKEDISFVNAHGTGTFDNDLVEAGVLADFLPQVPFLSTKGFTGHTLGAAGAIEAAFTVACLNLGRIPASAGFTRAAGDMPSCPIWEPEQLSGPIGLSQSLAFGGNNSVLLLRGKGV